MRLNFFIELSDNLNCTKNRSYNNDDNMSNKINNKISWTKKLLVIIYIIYIKN